ncbi:MAG: methyltransferase [Candidatus Hydrogenedentes bacterium]|nr:methyltransferase [Candidatus Hydrogenedentota bacterium]
MTSRERVMTALDHRAPDRVPVDLSGHRSSGIAAIAYARLRKHLGLPERPLRVYDTMQQLAVVDDDVLDRFGIDTIELGRAFATEDRDWADWVLPDGTPCQLPRWVHPQREEGRWVIRSKQGRAVSVMPDGALYFEQLYYPYLERDTFDDLADALDAFSAMATPPGPDAEGPDGLKRLEAGAKRLRASTDRAIIGLFGGNLLEAGQSMFRNDRFFMLLIEEPEKAHDFLDRLVTIHLANLDTFLGAVGDSIDIILFGDDLGAQNGPQISPDMYREFFKPRQKVMWDRVKARSNAKIMLHCCGGVRELLDDLIDAGLDTINPVQVSCAGMGAAALKRDFGDRITFWGGGCDTQQVVAFATPAEVRQHVLEQVAALGPGGGFVFQQVHNILANVPPENIVAMYDAVREANAL